MPGIIEEIQGLGWRPERQFLPQRQKLRTEMKKAPLEGMSEAFGSSAETDDR